MIIETGLGIRSANSYVAVDYVTNYLTARNRQTDWVAATTEVQQAAIIAATDYIEKRFSNKFQGIRKETFDQTHATALLTIVGSNLTSLNGQTITIGDEVWTFSFATFGRSYEILIGSDLNELLINLITAISNSRYTSIEFENLGILKLTSRSPGAGGNNTILTSTIPETFLQTTGFSGGVDGGIQPLSWPRNYVYDEQGIAIEGVPDILKQATAEYAVRAMTETLLPDPTFDSYSGSLQKRFEKVGPIEEEYEYVSGTIGKILFKPYPSADRILLPLLLDNGKVIRG